MGKAKKNIISLLIAAGIAVLSIAFLETRIGAFVHVRSWVKHLIPLFDGRRELMVNVLLGILGSALVGLPAFIIEYYSERKAFVERIKGRFIEYYIPILLRLGDGSMTMEEFRQLNLDRDLDEYYDNIAYVRKSEEVACILQVILGIRKIYWSCIPAYYLMHRLDEKIDETKSLQKEFDLALEDLVRDFEADKEELSLEDRQRLEELEERYRCKIRDIKKRIFEYEAFRQDIEDRIQFNMKEVVVGELYDHIVKSSKSSNAVTHIFPLMDMHDDEVAIRKAKGMSLENNIIPFTGEDWNRYIMNGEVSSETDLGQKVGLSH